MAFTVCICIEMPRIRVCPYSFSSKKQARQKTAAARDIREKVRQPDEEPLRSDRSDVDCSERQNRPPGQGKL